ncbi:MAG: SDR family oxidoreductase [Pseudomonadota bacterium]
MSNLRLEGKKALITGGTTGIGFETAQSFIQEGAQVMITGRSQDKIDSAVNALGGNAIGVVADSSSFNDLKKLATHVEKSFGNLDILFANAGNGVFSPLSDVTEESYDHQFDLNVKGVFFTVQQMLPLLAKGSSIVLTASAVHGKGFSGGSLYFASKAAVRSFARSMAAELGPQGIRVNTLSPGLIPTKFFSNSNIGDAGYEPFAQAITSSAPLARVGNALEIANAAVFLGSDESSYMTAADLVIDGGWMNV